MQTITLEFPHNARTVYTAVKNLLARKRTKFSAVKCDDDLFVIEARHGAWLSPFSEHVKLRVVATGSSATKVVIESSSRSVLNLLNLGANKANVSDLRDYISNEVFRIQHVTVGRDEEEIEDVDNDHSSHSSIRIATPSILTREPKNG